MSQTLDDLVIVAIADILEIPAEAVTSKSRSSDFKQWDSLCHLNIVLSMEQQFGVEFSPDEITELLSIESIVSAITAKSGR